MSSRIALFFIFTALVANAKANETVVRLNVNYAIEKNNLANSPITTDTDLINLLKSQGVSLDGKSEITIHEEKNAVNLICFKCLVRDLPPEEAAVSSYNERTLK